MPNHKTDGEGDIVFFSFTLFRSDWHNAVASARIMQISKLKLTTYYYTTNDKVVAFSLRSKTKRHNMPFLSSRSRSVLEYAGSLRRTRSIEQVNVENG